MAETAPYSVRAGVWHDACDVRWDFSADGLSLGDARRMAATQSEGDRFAAVYGPEGKGPNGLLLDARCRDGAWMA